MIIVSSDYIDFGQVSKNVSIIERVTIYNTDNISVDVTNITSTSVDYIAAPTAFTIDGHESIEITIEYTATSVASQSGVISIVNSFGPNVNINVTATLAEPIVNIDTSALDFGDVGINDSKQLTKTIANDATNGSVLNVTISSSNSNFSVSPSNLSIDSGSSDEIVITFQPSSTGSKSGSIDLVTNDAIGSYSFNVSGEAAEPTFSVSTSLLDFGTAPVGAEKTLAFDVENTSTSVNLIISSVSIPDSQFTIDTSSVTIPPTGQQTFTVTFSPETTETLSDTMVLSTNAASNINVNYTGTGILTPVLNVITSEINYEKYPLSVDQTIDLQVENIGVVDLEISSIDFPTVTGATFSTSISFPYIVPHGELAIIDITANSITEAIFDDVITINSDSYDNPHTVSIKGEAQSPEIVVSVDELDFGTVLVGEEKILQFVIENTKEVDLVVTITEAPHFTVNDTNLTIAGESQVSVSVTFLLETIAEVTDVLNIASNDVANPSIDIDVKGSASLDHFFRVIPDTLIENFVSIDINTQSILSIFNRGLLPASIQSLTFTKLPDITANYDITTSSLPVTLQPGEVVEAAIDISSTSIGKIGGLLKFATKVGTNLEYDTSITVEYDGEIFSPTITTDPVAPGPVSFGNVPVGIASYETLTINNRGRSADLDVTLTSGNDSFFFKGTKEDNYTVEKSDSKYIAQMPNIDLVLESVNVIDNETGDALILGDPDNPGEFSVDTNTGIVSFNADVDTDEQSFKINYDYKQSTIQLTVNKFASIDVNVGFIPSDTGSDTAVLTIESNDTTTPTTVINAEGTGTPVVATIALLNELIKFETAVGTIEEPESISQKAVLKNTGNVKLFVTDIDVNEPFSVAKSQFSIDPNERYELEITFDSKNDTEILETIIIYSNAPDLNVDVVGQGGYAGMSIPASISFGQVGVNSSVTETFTISNVGSADLEVQLSLPSDVFSIAPTITTVKAGGTYDTTITFKPVKNEIYSALLKIISNDPNQPNINIPVSGEGVNAPVIEVTSKLEFLETNVLETSQETLTIKNIGSEDLAINKVEITDNLRDFEVTDRQVTIAPNSSESYLVSFNPKTIGINFNGGNSIYGKLNIESDDPNDPNVEVVLKGSAVNPDGQWQTLDFQELMPDALLSTANAIQQVIGPTKTILELIKTVIGFASVLLTDITAVTKVILTGIAALIEKFLNDLTATGLYILPVLPQKDVNPTVEADTKFGKWLASFAGGSEEFKTKIIDSFDDVFDAKRPQFSNDAYTAAVVLAVDSGNVVDIVKGVISLIKFFTSIDWEPDIQEPEDVTVTPASSGNLTVRWSLPELVNFSVRGIRSGVKIADLVWGFDVFRSEGQSSYAVADRDYYDDENKTNKLSSKGDTINIATKEKVDPIVTVKASDIQFNLLENFKVGWGAAAKEPVPALGYEYLDSGLDNGKSYFYSVRTRMGQSDDDPQSPLSNEVVGVPEATRTEDTVADFDLNHCSNYRCIKESTKYLKIIKLRKPSVKLFDLTGIERYGSGAGLFSDPVKVDVVSSIRENNRKQVSIFEIEIQDTGIDFSSITIKNPSRIERYRKEEWTAGEIGATLQPNDYFDNGQIVKKDGLYQWDGPNLDEYDVTVRSKPYFSNFLSKTSLWISNDIEVSEERNKTIIRIKDRRNIGYQNNDYVVVEYSKNYHLTCGINKRWFNEITCGNGTTSCPDYLNNRCAYHGGDRCLNVGNTLITSEVVKDFKLVKPNSDYFTPEGCRSGATGGRVRAIDRVKTNDPSLAVKVISGGECSGYSSVRDETVGIYPNWQSLSLQALCKPVEQFINELNNWVQREIDAIQKGSESIQKFLDLLVKKIEALEDIIDTIQWIIDILLSIFSVNVGFHLLYLDLEDGGTERIKRLIQTAEGGPDSGPDGYTAGVVMMVGGPNAAPIWQFIQLFFG